MTRMRVNRTIMNAKMTNRWLESDSAIYNISLTFHE